MEVYKRHLPVSNSSANGKYIASFDLNSDRICMVIVDRRGLLIDVRNEHFPEVINYPKEKAQDVRRKALKKLVEYALNHNISKFALREYLEHLKVLCERANVKNSSIQHIPLP